MNNLNTNRVAENSERDFFRIASYSTALGFGILLGVLESLYKDASGFAFRISGGTFLGFVIGAAVGLIYWKIVARNSIAGGSLVLRVSSFLLFLGGVGAFLYPVRFLPRERLPEVFQGLATAAIVLSLVGVMLCRISNFLTKDAARTEMDANEPARSR